MDQLRDTLRAALVKNVEDEAVFESLFDVYFAVQRERAAPLAVATSLDRTGDEGADDQDDGHVPGDPAQLLQALLEALRTGRPDALRALASMAVEQHAGIDADRSFSEPYYLYRVLRQLELSELLRAAIAQSSASTEESSKLDDRLLREELARRVEDLRRLISQEVRRQLAEAKGASLAADLVQRTADRGSRLPPCLARGARGDAGRRSACSRGSSPPGSRVIAGFGEPVVSTCDGPFAARSRQEAFPDRRSATRERPSPTCTCCATSPVPSPNSLTSRCRCCSR